MGTDSRRVLEVSLMNQQLQQTVTDSFTVTPKEIPISLVSSVTPNLLRLQMPKGQCLRETEKILNTQKAEVAQKLSSECGDGPGVHFGFKGSMLFKMSIISRYSLSHTASS